MRSPRVRIDLNRCQLCRPKTLPRKIANWPNSAWIVLSANGRVSGKRAFSFGSSKSWNPASAPLARPMKRCTTERPTNPYRRPTRHLPRNNRSPWIVIPMETKRIRRRCVWHIGCFFGRPRRCSWFWGSRLPRPVPAQDAAGY